MIITCSNVSKIYKKREKEGGFKGAIKHLFSNNFIENVALKNISFEINRGEIVGILGVNGAGKSTLIKILTGVIPASSGEVKVLNHDPYKKHKDFLKKIGVMFASKSKLWPDLPPIDLFELYGSIYGINTTILKERIDLLSQMLNVGHLLHTQVRQMSFGEKKKIELITSILHNPEIVFLDEPTIGMDSLSQKTTREFLSNYVQKTGATIIITSHNMQDIAKLCSRVLLIKRGELVFDGQMETLIKSAKEKVKIKILGEKIKNMSVVDNWEIITDENDIGIISIETKFIEDFLKKVTDYRKVIDIDIERKSPEDILNELYESINKNK